MRRFMIMILCLALASLACMQTTDAPAGVPVWTATATAAVEQVRLISPTLTKVATASPAPQICARVIAFQSLHLRAGASEKDIVLAWLKHDDVVQVLDQSNVDWWYIARDGVSGYARAKYLQIGECNA